MTSDGCSSRASVEQALHHISECSSYHPEDVAVLIVDTMPLNVSTYVLYPSHHRLTQAEEMQLFCERALSIVDLVSQRLCYESLRRLLPDRHSLYHTGTEQGSFHPLTKAQVLTELHDISCYIFYVLTRCAVSTVTAGSTQGQQNEDEFLRFVACVQSNVEITPRVMLSRASGQVDLRRLLLHQTRRSPPGIDESLIACWCGVDFYTKWYRCILPASFVSYGTFRFMRTVSQSIFASLLFEIAEDEEEVEDVVPGEAS